MKWTKAFQPHHCLLPNKDLRAVERDVPSDLLPAFILPLLPLLHLAELRLGPGLFAHIQSSRWLAAPQAQTQEEEVTLVCSQREGRLSQKQAEHSNIPNQVMSSAAMSNASHYMIKFKIKVTRGQTWTMSSDQTTVSGEEGMKQPEII